MLITALLLSTLFACDASRDSGVPFPQRHIQLATAMTREPLDAAETAWRAANNDLVIARIDPDATRPLRPDGLGFEYINLMHVRHPAEAAAFATTNGLDAESFYIHYRQDIFHPYYPTTVFVPGLAAGVIPGWNPSWQAGDPPASATSRSQSRAVGVNGPTWVLANVADPGYRAFLKDWTTQLLKGTAWGRAPYAGGPTEGILVDEAIYYAPFNIGYLDKTAEFQGATLDDTHPLSLAYESIHAELRAHYDAAVRPGTIVCPNYGHTWWMSHPSRIAQNLQAITTWSYGQVWIADRASGKLISYDDDYASGIASIAQQARAGGVRVLGAFDLSGGIAGTDRGRLYTLALYYLVHGPTTYYAYQSVELVEPAVPASQWQWNPAVTADVGTAEGEHYVHASGADPFVPALTYRVLARKFSRALVLAKMLPKGSVTDDRSATTHVLDRPRIHLNGDGSKGPLVTQVTLRNNEGAILLAP